MKIGFTLIMMILGISFLESSKSLRPSPHRVTVIGLSIPPNASVPSEWTPFLNNLNLKILDSKN
jgi:hypothetical protein